jgi:histidinol phosphatase-like PHP family hydrolase
METPYRTRVDGHIHTNKFRHHDQLRDALLALGINCMVCTDHFSVTRKYDYNVFKEGYMKMREVCRGTKLTVLAGAEITVDNDYLIYGCTMEQLREVCLASGDFHSMLNCVHRFQGLAIQAHPCRKKHGVFRQTINQNVDGYELYNGHHKQDNHNGEIATMMAWRNPIFTSGSDAHGGAALGRAYMEFKSDIADEQQLATCLRTFYHSNFTI